MTRLVYGNFIRVWREKEAALHESRLKRLLLLNLSHEGPKSSGQPVIESKILIFDSTNASQRRR